MNNAEGGDRELCFAYTGYRSGDEIHRLGWARGGHGRSNSLGLTRDGGSGW